MNLKNYYSSFFSPSLEPALFLPQLLGLGPLLAAQPPSSSLPLFSPISPPRARPALSRPTAYGPHAPSPRMPPLPDFGLDWIGFLLTREPPSLLRSPPPSTRPFEASPDTALCPNRIVVSSSAFQCLPFAISCARTSYPQAPVHPGHGAAADQMLRWVPCLGLAFFFFARSCRSFTCVLF